jgi:ribosomal protein S18 acetylase RimI-like enzyme
MTVNKPDNILSKITIRPLRETDDLNEITLLLNRAYKFLADMGFKYLASHQEIETTKERIRRAKCFVAVLKEKPKKRIIGIICYYSPKNAYGCELYDRPEVAYFGQFGVEPEFQKSGIGNLLIVQV